MGNDNSPKHSSFGPRDRSETLQSGPCMVLDKFSRRTIDSGFIFHDLGAKQHFGRDLDVQDQARDWPGGLGLAHTFLFLMKSKKHILFLVGRPTPSKMKKDYLMATPFREGQIPDQHFCSVALKYFSHP